MYMYEYNSLFYYFYNDVCCQCRWGCTHERDGIQAYKAEAIKSHEELHVIEAGLFIDSERPYLGASPDNIITCKCFGKGVLEVKCPFCVKDGLPEENGNGRAGFCMSRKWEVGIKKKPHILLPDTAANGSGWG